jgi:hypothetical protein
MKPNTELWAGWLQKLDVIYYAMQKQEKTRESIRNLPSEAAVIKAYSELKFITPNSAISHLGAI